MAKDFKIILIWNHFTIWQQTWLECALDGPFQNISFFFFLMLIGNPWWPPSQDKSFNIVFLRFDAFDWTQNVLEKSLVGPLQNYIFHVDLKSKMVATTEQIYHGILMRNVLKIILIWNQWTISQQTSLMVIYEMCRLEIQDGYHCMEAF